MAGAEVVYVVRHAKAGNRQAWPDDDTERPLSREGRKQSAALAERLATKRVTELWSSPYVRCVQTLEPLAACLDTEVRVDDRLAEEQSHEGMLELLAQTADRSVLCSHGDVIPSTIHALVRRGMEVQGPVDWRKGTVWVLQRTGDRITKGKVWAPPA
jgi:8-oxo-dGTP diphosphatase